MRIPILAAAAALGLLTVGGAQAAGINSGAIAVAAASAASNADVIQAGWRRGYKRGYYGYYGGPGYYGYYGGPGYYGRPPYCVRNPNRCWR